MATYQGIPIAMNTLCAIDEQVQHVLASFTVMFYIKGEKGKEGIGSGIHIIYKEKEYLITAGHVFQDLTTDCNFLKKVYVDFINIPVDDFPRPAIIFPECDNDNFCEPDYAIFPVDDRLSAKFHDMGMQPYVVSEQVTKWRCVMLRALVFGYPASFNEAKKKRFQKDALKTKYYCLDLPLHLHSEVIPHWDNNCNIALEYRDRGLIASEDIESGLKRNAPPLNGMSGGGIWSIPSYPIASGAPILLGMFTSVSTEYEAAIGFTVQDMVIAIEKAEEEFFTIKRNSEPPK